MLTTRTHISSLRGRNVFSVCDFRQVVVNSALKCQKLPFYCWSVSAKAQLSYILLTDSCLRTTCEWYVFSYKRVSVEKTGKILVWVRLHLLNPVLLAFSHCVLKISQQLKIPLIIYRIIFSVYPSLSSRLLSVPASVCAAWTLTANWCQSRGPRPRRCILCNAGDGRSRSQYHLLSAHTLPLFQNKFQSVASAWMGKYFTEHEQMIFLGKPEELMPPRRV